jgi:class 3 adenylate cyclase
MGTVTTTQGMMPNSVRIDIESGLLPEPKHHNNVTIVVIEIPEFDDLAKSLHPVPVFLLIEKMQAKFDDVIAKYPGLYKLNSVADKLIVSTGLMATSVEQTEEEILEETIEALQCAKELRDTMEELDFEDMGIDEDDILEQLNVRAGIHSGSASGVSDTVWKIVFVFWMENVKWVKSSFIGSYW